MDSTVTGANGGKILPECPREAVLERAILRAFLETELSLQTVGPLLARIREICAREMAIRTGIPSGLMRVCSPTSGWRSVGVSACPVWASQIWALPFSLAVTRRVPSRLNAACSIRLPR